MYLLQIYRGLIKNSWVRAVEYRAQVVLWLISSIFPLVMMSVWLAVVDEVGPAAGWTRADFISYYVGLSLVYQLTFSYITWRWDEDIRTGDLSVKLLKPIDPMHHHVTDHLGWKLMTLIVMLPLLVLAAVLLEDVRYAFNPLIWLACAAACAVGFLVNVFMASAFAMVGFWSGQARNVFSLWFGVGQFLSGFIAPLSLFPDAIRQTAALMPFRSTVGFPMEILMGRLSWNEIGFGFAVGLGWCAGFFAVYRLLWHSGLRRYDAVGT